MFLAIVHWPDAQTIFLKVILSDLTRWPHKNHPSRLEDCPVGVAKILQCFSQVGRNALPDHDNGIIHQEDNHEVPVDHKDSIERRNEAQEGLTCEQKPRHPWLLQPQGEQAV